MRESPSQRVRVVNPHYLVDRGSNITRGSLETESMKARSTSSKARSLAMLRGPLKILSKTGVAKENAGGVPFWQ